MRVSVSRSKNFPRPTSSSNFLSHPHACTPSFPSPPTTVVEKLNDPPVKKRPPSINRYDSRSFQRRAFENESRIERFKGGSLFSLILPSSLATTVRHPAEAAQRRSWLERRDFIRTAALLADYSFSFLRARCGLCRPAPVER